MTTDQAPKGTPVKPSRTSARGSIVDLMMSVPQLKESIVDQRKGTALAITQGESLPDTDHGTGEPITNKAAAKAASLTSHIEVAELDPKRIRPWAFADRPNEEYGDIGELMASIQASGQIQPIIVRAVFNDSSFDYELIAGARRRLACEQAGCNVKAIVTAIDDRSAFLLMREENDKRTPLSPWANAVAYRKAIDQGVYTSDRDLARHLGVSSSAVTDLMSYFRVHSDLAKAINSFSNVSITTVKTIISTLDKHPESLGMLIAHAGDIRSGKFSSARVRALIETSKADSGHTYSTSTGKEVMTFRSDSNGTPVFSLLKAARDVVDPETLAKDILSLIEKYERDKILRARNAGDV